MWPQVPVSLGAPLEMLTFHLTLELWGVVTALTSTIDELDVGYTTKLGDPLTHIIVFMLPVVSGRM